MQADLLTSMATAPSRDEVVREDEVEVGLLIKVLLRNDRFDDTLHELSCINPILGNSLIVLSDDINSVDPDRFQSIYVHVLTGNSGFAGRAQPYVSALLTKMIHPSCSVICNKLAKHQNLITGSNILRALGVQL